MAWKPTRGTTRTASTAWRRIREQAKTRLPFYCVECESTDNLELDHIIPVCEGGADVWCNFQWLCRDCHKIKTQMEAQRARVRARDGLGAPLGFVLDVEPAPAMETPHL